MAALTMNGKGFQVSLLIGQFMCGQAGKDCTNVFLGGCVLEGRGSGGKACGWIQLHAVGNHHNYSGREGQ